MARGEAAAAGGGRSSSELLNPKASAQGVQFKDTGFEHKFQKHKIYDPKNFLQNPD
jgi:hypothetical protein